MGDVNNPTCIQEIGTFLKVITEVLTAVPKVEFCDMCRHVSFYLCTNVSEEPAASIYRVDAGGKDGSNTFLQNVGTIYKLHDITSHRTEIFTFARC
jgi:hypothetical protein